MARNRNFPRKVKQWRGLGGTVLTLTGSSTNIAGSISFTEAQTVIRILGEYTIGPTAAPAALDSVHMNVGLCVASTDAVAVGATAMPDPADEPEFPWLYWKQHMLFYASTASVQSSQAANLRHSFDIRSMRKFSPRESLVLITEYGDLTGTPPITVSFAQTRVMVGLS